MRVLVCAASKHGATAEIASVIAIELTRQGLEVDLRAADDVQTVEPYDAVVLGSGVYAGHWLQPVKELVNRHVDALASLSVWLFSSGPIGDPPKPSEEPTDATEIRRRINAVDHRVFAGRLERADKGFAERLLMSALRAPEGDFRPWPEITAWATSIAESRMVSPAAR